MDSYTFMFTDTEEEVVSREGNMLDVIMVRICSFCWKLLHRKTYGYDMLSLVLLGNSARLVCCILRPASGVFCARNVSGPRISGLVGLKCRVLSSATNFQTDRTFCHVTVGLSIKRDLLPSDDVVDLPFVERLNKGRAPIRKYDEVFLSGICLSRSFVDDDVCPTFIGHDCREMGLLDFVKSSGPFKVTTGVRNTKFLEKCQSLHR
uniref:Transposase (Putative), gypsy type n=1 Tax=Tanacetum cinerariifolium TaxID=118510 RepID=A0A6L2K3S3_TANCI|nr:transposase (putative), gypsy type [Tanacetum cinerariifolium]